MAKGGFRPMFNMGAIKQVFDQFQEQIDSQVLESLQYVGEEFVDKARLKKPYDDKGRKLSYEDQTANLRSSIGYIILKDGEIVDRNFKGNALGQSQGKRVAEEVANEHPNGWVLIGVAGMDYAAYVEAKGYDVITGSAPTSAMIMSILRKIKP